MSSFLKMGWRAAPVIAFLGLLAVLVSGCGSSSSSTSSSTTQAAVGATGNSGATGARGQQPPPSAQVRVTYEKPQSKDDALGYQLLTAARTKYLATTLASTFQLPHPLLVKGVDGVGGGPFYDPQDNSITLPYGFASLVFSILKHDSPNQSNYDLGSSFGAVQSFLLAHEFGHALVANFHLPVLGSNEDAADKIATILVLKASAGAQYATDAAHFFADFSGRQNPPAVADYADTHSLDLQRAFDILCDVAGSSKESFQNVAALHVLPQSRLQTCPGQYQQDVDSITQELKPHIRGHIDLSAPK